MPIQRHIADWNFIDPAPRYAAPPAQLERHIADSNFIAPSAYGAPAQQQGGNYVSTAAPLAAPAPANHSNAMLWIGTGILVLLFMGKKR